MSFADSLELVNGLFCIVQAEKQHYLIHSSTKQQTHVHLAVLLLPAGTIMYEREFCEEELNKHRKSLKLVANENEWENYFSRLRRAMREQSAFVERNEAKSTALLTIICFFGGRQLLHKFRLRQVPDTFCAKKSGEIILKSVLCVRKQYELEDEVAKLRIELLEKQKLFEDQKSQNSSNSPSSLSLPSTHRSPRHSPSRRPTARQPVKRRPGMSLLNPRARRKIVKRARIVTDDDDDDDDNV